MKYSDIINFNPIQTVIQLKDANDETKAKNLVESYVMSEIGRASCRERV